MHQTLNLKYYSENKMYSRHLFYVNKMKLYVLRNAICTPSQSPLKYNKNYQEALGVKLVPKEQNNPFCESLK